ncbi:sigma-70 family RNA polymerase sigma factor [Desulfamplus magnetovallimortis]|uniref:sigma-70 family RNA polymerase sigma factor n=1 Tax=Desulfamplus magnetovallimortis TaxID=1246637 RepID=UPI00164898BB|nr:sigma-70 family RNA polymerase sigma factor [Desulfamplus magnetovallimortis]
MNKKSSSYWDSFIVANEKLIYKMVYQRCPEQPELREELVGYIHEKLFEDDRRRLRLFDPDRGSSQITYLCSVVNRIISSYFQNRFGRFRPPQKLVRQDDFLMLRIYRHLCFEKMRKTDLIEYLKNSVPGKRKTEVIEKKINTILEEFPYCTQTEDVEVDPEDVHLTDDVPSQESKMVASHEADVVQLIFATQNSSSETAEKTPLHRAELQRIQEQLSTHFNISAEKRLFLRMIYQDGMSITDAGKQVGWNKNQAVGHHRRLLEKLKEILSRHF